MKRAPKGMGSRLKVATDTVEEDDQRRGQRHESTVLHRASVTLEIIEVGVNAAENARRQTSTVRHGRGRFCSEMLV